MYMYILHYTTTYLDKRLTNEQGIRMFSIAAIIATMTKPTTLPIRRSVRHYLLDYHRVVDELLVAAVHAETDAGTLAIRATVKRMEQQGEIYNAAGDTDAPEWKVTRA